MKLSIVNCSMFNCWGNASKTKVTGEYLPIPIRVLNNNPGNTESFDSNKRHDDQIISSESVLIFIMNYTD